MPADNLDRLQSAYKAAVEEWIAAIKQEEELASVNHSVAEVDTWEAAHFKEDARQGPRPEGEIRRRPAQGILRLLGAAIASIPACGPRERTAALLRVLPGLHQV